MSIQEYLDAFNMTAQQLAELSGVSASTICRWKQGRGGNLAKFALVVKASGNKITCTVKPAPARRRSRAA